MGSIACSITIDVPPFSVPYVPFGLAHANASHHGYLYFNEHFFKIAVRSDRLCILVAGLRTNRGAGLHFRELMYGRIKMMTALCPAWAHTYQTMCLGFHPEQLRPEAFRLPNLFFFTFRPTCRRKTGIESPGWRLVTDGGCKRKKLTAQN